VLELKGEINTGRRGRFPHCLAYNFFPRLQHENRGGAHILRRSLLILATPSNGKVVHTKCQTQAERHTEGNEVNEERQKSVSGEPLHSLPSATRNRRPSKIPPALEALAGLVI
jgi:hypothetical protein